MTKRYPGNSTHAFDKGTRVAAFHPALEQREPEVITVAFETFDALGFLICYYLSDVPIGHEFLITAAFMSVRGLPGLQGISMPFL